jgi:hypothetical protein
MEKAAASRFRFNEPSVKIYHPQKYFGGPVLTGKSCPKGTYVNENCKIKKKAIGKEESGTVGK